MSDAKQEGIGRRDFLKHAAAGAALAAGGKRLAAAAAPADTSKILNYNEHMEYRRLGKTDLWVSAVCLGGHWKRLQVAMGRGIAQPPAEAMAAFLKNRADVVSKCIDVGINYVDACSPGEILTYARVLRGRREKMYFGFSWHTHELRFPDWRTKDKLIRCIDEGLRQAGLDYVDIWRVSALMNEPQPDADIDATVEAFEKVHAQGKVRFLGISSHHHPFLKRLVENWPQVSVILFPYTVDSKELPQDSLFEAVRKHDVGVFGIKSFASNSIFKGDSQPGNPMATDDDELARLTIRYILGNEAITAPIPGLIDTHQVENVALAVRERRELDSGEQAKLKRAAEEMVANLPPDYEWLRDWEWV